MSEIELCYCVDDNTIDCGYVSAYSFYSKITPDRYPSLMVCHEKGTKSPVPIWEKRFKKRGINIPLIRGIEIDATEIRKCKSLFDSYATYFRLFAPDYAVGKTLIYSDSDILYLSGIENLLGTELKKSTIALISGVECSERDPIERNVLNKYGKNDKDMYYGAGLAVIDVGDYISNKIHDKCLEVIRDDAASLKSHDQTVWNCAIQKIQSLDHLDIWAAYKRDSINRGKNTGIAHFVGAPKPWDLGGEFIHDHYALWHHEELKSGLCYLAVKKYFHNNMWKRAWRIRKQYS